LIVGLGLGNEVGRMQMVFMIFEIWVWRMAGIRMVRALRVWVD
jgi:hypothetical protein